MWNDHSKERQAANVGENVEKLESSHVAGGNVTCGHFEKQSDSSSKC